MEFLKEVNTWRAPFEKLTSFLRELDSVLGNRAFFLTIQSVIPSQNPIGSRCC